MSTNDNDGAFDIDDRGQQSVIGQPNAGLPSSLEQALSRRESAVLADEAAVLNRESSATAREDAVLLREAAASLRELAISTIEAAQTASDGHMLALQQANAHLVVATIEAQKLVEQIEITKIQLMNAKLVAEQASLAKSAFLSSMSHELRTPLNAILGFAQLLEAGSPPPSDVQMVRLHQIIKAGWYLLELINEILDLAVIESGKLTLSREPLLLIDVVRECQAMIETQAQQRGIRLDFLPFDHTWFVNADRTRLKQVLINLLTNAIKYNREQGTVVVACSASTPQRLRISVKDSGAGLPPEKLAQLFQPFNRLGQENGAEQGTGIGLVVTKQLIELMGGTIGVESTVGAGSEFWIELSRDLMPQLASGQTMPAGIIQAQANPVLRTLLYVEDNPANLMLVEQIIERYPHLRMLSARNGDLGVALAKLHLPDVILMDINLPGISGFQAVHLLRENPVTAHIPVIALSANAMRHDIEKGLEAGFFRYLTKPIKLDELMDTLNMALGLAESGFDGAITRVFP
ncbi:ATP-binding protein [Sulfuriferula sp. GW1]|uniref:ATP-binding protein n=1 Tax=Sulfuriferula sp. GW1 TaxID=3345111 RepID=UPI0039B081D0